MKIGYARVSTDDQNLNLQRDALRVAGCEKVFEDTMSGAKSQRPGLADCMSFAREGDTVVVWRLDRLGRSMSDLIHLVGELEQKNVGFESLNERIETTSATGRLVFHIFGAFAEFERNLARERTNAGLKAARTRGKLGGRKALSAEKIAQIRKYAADKTLTVAEACAKAGVSRSTLYRYAAPGGESGREAQT